MVGLGVVGPCGCYGRGWCKMMVCGDLWFVWISYLWLKNQGLQPSQRLWKKPAVCIYLHTKLNKSSIYLDAVSKHQPPGRKDCQYILFLIGVT